MQIFRINKATTTQLQWLVWISVYLVTFFSLLPMDGFMQSSLFTLVNTVFYALIIYGNISFLYPRIYERGRKATYIVITILFLLLCGMARGFLILSLYNKYFALRQESTTFYTLLYYCLTGMLIYVLSFVFRIALAYFSLKQQTEEIRIQKTLAELNLLKSQVQPHFLFNTLNNIYYEAYLEAPRTAVLIERLAAIMRYFVDESPKADVPIDTEVSFLENYIELEKIRLRHELTITFSRDYPAYVTVPPMLMMTLVENVFKHGVDRSGNQNKIEISLVYQEKQLTFTTKNTLHRQPEHPNGFGLQNLKKRLALLYGTQYELFIEPTEQFYVAGFKIPIQ